MSINHNKQQIYTEPFPSNRINAPPFKKSSNCRKKFDVSLRNIPIVYHSTQAYLYVKRMIERVLQYIFGNEISIFVIVTLSILFNLVQINFEAFLVYQYRDQYGVGLLVGLLIVTLIYLIILLINFFGQYRSVAELRCLLILYALSFVLYFGLTISAICYMNASAKIYSIILFFLFLFSINVPGIFLSIGIIALLFFSILFLVEMLLRKLAVVCKKEEGIGMFSYYTYLYDGTKTLIKNCTICLQIFNDNDLICIAKCHPSHMFHEKCIAEWMKSSTICSICRSPANFY